MARFAIPILVALLAAPAAAWAGEPTPALSAAANDGICDEAIRAWAAGASRRIGREVTPVGCPTGMIRFQIAGAGCDYEVTRTGGFQRTADGKLGISPIANLDWSQAPEPMKKGFADLLSALAADPSLPIPSGAVIRRRAGGPPLVLGMRPTRLFARFAAGVLAAGALGFFWSRQKGRSPAPRPST
ncbi:MAG: hypothetical protein QM820_29910 [Minicystis sp.]